MRAVRALGAAAALCLALVADAVRAQAVDPMTQCLTEHTSPADRIVLIRWVFAGMSSSDAVKDLASVAPEKRTESIRAAGKLVERLLTRDCRPQTVARLKADPDAMKESFGKLGERAMMDLMQDPRVLAVFAGIIQYVDLNAMMGLMLESGVAPSQR
jgi:hypothetical protein